MSPQQAKPTYSNYHFQDLPQSSQYFWNVYYNRDIHAGALPSGSLQSRGPGLLNQLHDKANLLSSSKKRGGGAAQGVERKKATLARNWELLFWKHNFTVYTKPVINMQH